MILEFTATESGFDNGMGGASNAADTGQHHYVLFGKDGDGVYFEFDDQIHGGVDQVARISIHPDRVVFALRDSNVITVRRQMGDLPWSAFVEGVRQTFSSAIVTGNEPSTAPERSEHIV